ncbi:hypothetical protein OPQ81_006308 [Rhizoctonia solani]|nr:hypothetical protein OPQ81_006308 [Rhizoctonia solani]
MAQDFNPPLMNSPKPLLGHNGIYRISIVGNSGSGKSTLGRHLSKHLQIPHLSIDELFWNPGWVPAEPDVLRERVQTFIGSNPGGWIVDGNYRRMIGPIVQDAATDVLWLDPPLLVNFWRVLRRTFGRLFLGEPPCAPGCDEDIRETLGSKKSILLWCLSYHGVCRREFGPIWERESAEAGKGKWRRFGVWGGDLGRWLGRVTSSIR